MKYPQQLDAHIKSYKRERIRKLLQTFREQKELLTLSEEPVKKIHYKISFPETSAIIALLPKKPDILKFPPVEYKKTKKVTPPTFKELNYKHQSPDINPEKITANINFHKNKPVQFKPTNQNITLPVLKTSTINFGKINFKNNFNTAELKPMPEVSKTTYQNIKIDTNFCNGIKLNDIPKASLPKFRNTDINIPPVKKKNFRLPDLDFSDTLEKLKNAIIKDMGKYNEE